MQFNNTTTKDGLIQECEFWCGMSVGYIAGDSSMLALFTNRINRALEQVTSILGGKSAFDSYDDSNFSTHPFGYVDLISGVNDYQLLTDTGGNAITEITHVFRLEADGSYTELPLMTLDEKNAPLVMSPNTTQTGKPTGYVERNNTIFLDKKPTEALVHGLKVFYKRAPSFFVVSDTTKKPGFSSDHHALVALIASCDWLYVNKSENQQLIASAMRRRDELMSNLHAWVRLRNPLHNRMTPAYANNR